MVEVEAVIAQIFYLLIVLTIIFTAMVLITVVAVGYELNKIKKFLRKKFDIDEL